jgi:tetratricopeptide (TPR) repeat protein
MSATASDQQPADAGAAGPGRRTGKAKRSPRRRAVPTFVQTHRVALVAAAVTLAFALYARTLGNGFIAFDDPENVVDNLWIRELSLANLGHYFTTALQYMYTPLVWLSYAIDYQLGGADPTAYHFTNLAIHLANVVLVYLFVRELTRRPTPAVFAAGAFAIHPMNVDGIAWVATRSNLLATLFSLGALLLYARWLREPRRWHLPVAGLLFGLATLSKSAAVVLPVTLLLIDFYRRRPWRWRLLLEKIPFFAIAVGMGIVTLSFRIDTVNPYGYNLLDRVVLVCSALTHYLVKLFAPVNLAFAHAYPAKTGALLPWYLYLTPVLLALVVWAAWRWHPSRRTVLFGLGFFLVNVLLSQTVLLIDNYEASRYVYLPYVGLFVILGDLVDRALRDRTRVRTAVAWVLVLATAAFGTLTTLRAGAWKSTETIMSDSIDHDPHVAFVYNSRGIARYQAGNYPGARADFEQAIAVDPDFILSVYYRGILRELAGDYTAALADFDVAVARYPGFASAFAERAKTRAKLSDPSGALADFATALSLDPYQPTTYHERGLVETDLGDLPAAVADFDQAVSLDSGFAAGYASRATAKSRLGDLAGACADQRTAQSLGTSPQPILTC